MRNLSADEGTMIRAAPLQLLAKTPRGARKLTLFQHLDDTERAARLLFRDGTRWARSYPRFFKLQPEQHAAFLLNLRIAALFHDIGKANEDFQKALVAKAFTQSLRHEHLSALLLSEPSVIAWLSTNGGLDVDVIISAVLSHHLKAGEDGDWKVLRPRHGPSTALFFNHRQVQEALCRIAEIASLEPFTASLPAGRYPDAAWNTAWEGLFERAARFASQLRKDEARMRLSLAVKAGLIMCDSVSSALWRDDRDFDAWIEGVAHRVALARDDIDRHVLERRIAELGDKWHGWHGFQSGAASVGRRGLLLAACGSGKTLAAWRWASEVSQDVEIGRVIFLYPTRGTATEGFRDYVAHAPEGEAALVHGTSKYELAGMMENPEELPASLKGKNAIVDESEARLFALGLWNKRYFSATVDQFLGFIENAYGGLCLLPALADAAVVFDEIHSYDPKMWNALVTFLERFDVPVLCMTATLPPTRRKQLEERCGLRCYPTARELRELTDLEEKETCPRYRLRAAQFEDALAEAVAAVGAGQRVLWVVNTVRRCQQLARTLKGCLGPAATVGVYHSRFKLEDRQRRHRETIDAFRAPLIGEPPPAIAVTTQVCEMSLDLDADVLITEHAPISSLVQRFGRANRHLRRGTAFRAKLITYVPEAPAPYDKKDLDQAAKFLAELSEHDVSQPDLALGLEKHARCERHASGSTAFIDGGYFAVSGALRDSDDIGVPVVLDGDIERFKELTKCGEPTDGLRLTVPKKRARALEGLGLPHWLKVADSSRYDTWLGFVIDDEPTAT
jgi:CRISPR-associated endonuclease/helicase Cas3